MSEKIPQNQAFMAAFEAATTPVDGAASRIWDGKVIISINARRSDDEVHINQIEVIDRGKAYGHEAMRFLTALADEFGVAMGVEAIPAANNVMFRTVNKLYDAGGFCPPQSSARMRWREPVTAQAEEPKAKVQENNNIASGPVAF